MFSVRTTREKVWRDSIAQLREASDLFRRAAESGISDASYQLGMLYQQGLGIPVDPVAAFENFLVAANGSTVHTAAGVPRKYISRRRINSLVDWTLDYRRGQNTDPLAEIVCSRAEFTS